MSATNEFSALSIIQGSDAKAMAESMGMIRQYQALIKNTLVQGHDYGTIPGAGTKPTLLKPGAEKICLLFKLNPEYVVASQIEDYDKGFFTYSFICTIYKTVVQDGQVLKFPVSQGVGNCNSKEEKYRYVHYYESELPPGVDKSTLRRKSDKRGGFKYRMENQEPCSIVNTVYKMAKKRAFIDAALQVVSLSELFTQDLEDLSGTDYADSGELDERISNVRQAAPEPQQAPAQRPASIGNYILKFGNKHNGKPLLQIAQDDPTYLTWVADKSNAPEEIKLAIRTFLAGDRFAVPVSRPAEHPATVAIDNGELDAGYVPPDDNDLPFRL